MMEDLLLVFSCGGWGRVLDTPGGGRVMTCDGEVTERG